MTYVVIENTPGYLPDEDDPATFESETDAREYLKERVESYCEHLDEIDTTYVVSWDRELTSAYVSERSDRTYDLGRSFTIEQDES